MRIYKDRDKYFIKNIIVGFFLAIISLYYVNSTMFEHTHIINGVTIKHSHFHSKNHTSSSSEKHTEREITLIHALTFTQALISKSILLDLVKATVDYTLVIPIKYSLNDVDFTLHKSSRAPPVYFA